MSRNKRKKRKWRKVEINQSALSKNKGNKKSNKKGNEFGSIKDSELFFEDLDDEIKTNKIQTESGKGTKKFLSQHKREKHKNKIMDYEKRINKTSPINKNKTRIEIEKEKEREKTIKEEKPKQQKKKKQTKKEQEQKKKKDKENKKKKKQVQNPKPKKAKNTKAKEKKIVSIWGFDDDQKKTGKKKKNNNWQRFGKNRKFKTHRTELPDPGQSYNPDPEEHKKFVEKIEKQKQILRNRAKKASTVPKIFDRYVHEENKNKEKSDKTNNNQNKNKTNNKKKNKNKNKNEDKKNNNTKKNHLGKQQPDEKKPKIEKEIILGNVWVISEHDTDKINKELEKKIKKKRDKNRRRREIKKKMKEFHSKKNIPSRKRQHLKKKNDKKLNIDKLIENEKNSNKKKKRRLLKSNQGLNSIKGWHEIEPVAKLDSNNISLLSVQNQTNLATDHLRQLRGKRITEPRVKKEKKFYKVNTNINGHLLF
ncbi:hypothetical protein M0812_21283 [Anaeramoeba flamelloides]|uniref:Ribosome biogenesis protein NOP53 n=1 Tax=Anaeramoeba flamelloides TaxID=1746091 RepID=A0AAV7YXB2_9EUKA|nr:hypothetical protein M0812_21283 [Anaeramoeba flamelloides]